MICGIQLLFNDGIRSPFFETETDEEYLQYYDESNDTIETYSIDTRRVISRIEVEDERSGGFKNVRLLDSNGDSVIIN